MFTYFKIFVVLILTMSSVKAEFFMGIAQGVHLQGEQLNDTHPYYGVKYKNFGTLTYLNSFNRIGFAAYYEFSNRKDGIEFTFKVGATTGYNPRMKFGNHTYSLERRLFFNNNIMLLLIPGVSIYMSDDSSFDITLLGDSLNVGLTIRF